MLYGSDDSILGVSELDGFFTALACAPNTVMPSHWMPALWGGEALSPEWETIKEFEAFSDAVFMLYNNVMQSLDGNKFEPLFPVEKVEDKTYTIVDEWCNGFLRSLNLWGPMASKDAAFTEECIQSIRLFATEAGFKQLDSMSEAEVIAQQQSIEPGVLRLFQHFSEQRKPVTQTIIPDQPKVGRNDPCPCGSGKKFKKCCLH